MVAKHDMPANLWTCTDEQLAQYEQEALADLMEAHDRLQRLMGHQGMRMAGYNNVVHMPGRRNGESLVGGDGDAA